MYVSRLDRHKATHTVFFLSFFLLCHTHTYTHTATCSPPPYRGEVDGGHEPRAELPAREEHRRRGEEEVVRQRRRVAARVDPVESKSLKPGITFVDEEATTRGVLFWTSDS
jgi:hypothetical protein